MATLTRPKTTVRNPFLDSQVPAPFPRELLEDEQPIIESDVEAEPRTVAIVRLFFTLKILQNMSNSNVRKTLCRPLFI